MARKRDYKAAYARAKVRSQSRGYTSPHDERKARRLLKLPRGFAPIDKKDLPAGLYEILPGKRRDAKEWASIHSHGGASKYRGNMSNTQAEDYYRAFVEPYANLGPSRRKRAIERRTRIKAYVIQYGYAPDNEETNERYSTAPSS